MTIRRTIFLACYLLVLLASGGMSQNADLADPNIPALELAGLNQQVQSNVEQDNYQQALELVKLAARKYPHDMALRNKFATLKKVIQLREQLEIEQDLQKWLSISQYLRYYYLSGSLNQAALEIDRKTYEKDKSVKNAENLIGTMIICSLDQQAREIVVSIDKPSVRVHTLELLILARAGQARQALELFQELQIDYQHHPLTMFDLARIAILADEKDIWVNSLIYAQRYSSERALTLVRKMILDCPEFKHLHDDQTFRQVINTPSRITDAKCPASDDCQICPAN